MLLEHGMGGGEACLALTIFLRINRCQKRKQQQQHQHQEENDVLSSQNIRLATQQLHRLSLNRNRTPCTCIDAITLALVISNYRYLMIINGDHVENDVHLQQGKEQLLTL